MSRCRNKKVKKPSMEQLTIRRLTIEANNHQRDMCERREHYQKQLQKKNTTIQNLKEQRDALIDLVTLLSAKMDQHNIDTSDVCGRVRNLRQLIGQAEVL